MTEIADNSPHIHRQGASATPVRPSLTTACNAHSILAWEAQYRQVLDLWRVLFRPDSDHAQLKFQHLHCIPCKALHVHVRMFQQASGITCTPQNTPVRPRTQEPPAGSAGSNPAAFPSGGSRRAAPPPQMQLLGTPAQQNSLPLIRKNTAHCARFRRNFCDHKLQPAITDSTVCSQLSLSPPNGAP